MAVANSFLTDLSDRIRLSLRVKLKSSRTGPLGVRVSDRTALEWGVASAPIDGAANSELLRAISRYFEVARGNVTIVVGEQSREKTVEIYGITAAHALTFLSKDI